MFRAIVVAAALLSASAAAGASEVRGRATVIDANTFAVNGTVVHLDGIEAPESNQRCNMDDGIKWFCGRAAAAVLFLIVQERDVVCRIDPARESDDGAAMARCSVAGKDVGGEMIRRGMAWAADAAPAGYRALQQEAEKIKRGVYQAETERASEFRARRWREAKSGAPGACPIKGNVDPFGRRIYHLPWSQWYALTKVTEARGERWFCSEHEAIAAGWRRAAWNFVPRLAAGDMPAGGVLENQR
ncbi:MAG: thermonuclease family protein [Hyphomicrobiaceae bacterium]